MARIVQCPGSVVMQERYPEPEGPEAKEGTAAHWAFAELADGRDIALGQIAPNGVVLTAEMIEGAELMHDETCELPNPAVESAVTIERIHLDCWGTPDFRSWRVPRARLRIVDFKFGHGYVEAYENWQLISYAAGAVAEGAAEGHGDCVVELGIVQPRNYHRDGPVRTWTTTVGTLCAYWNIAGHACNEAMSATPRTRAGPECKHCTARHACPTLANAALGVLDDAGKSIPLDLKTVEAATELRRLNYAAEILSSRRSGLENQLLVAARQGESVPYFHVEHGEGREAWTAPVGEVIALGKFYGVDLAAPVEAVTPFQARKKGVDSAGFTQRQPGAAKLVADSPYQAAKIFAKVPQ